MFEELVRAGVDAPAQDHIDDGLRGVLWCDDAYLMCCRSRCALASRVAARDVDEVGGVATRTRALVGLILQDSDEGAGRYILIHQRRVPDNPSGASS